MAKKKITTPRDKVIKIWLTEAEMQLIRIAAAVAGSPAATYARKVVLEQAAQSEQRYLAAKQKEQPNGTKATKKS